MTELEAKAKDCIENHTHKLVDKPTKQDIYLREESIFISGYKLGATENGIQWHDLRKDPNDLPDTGRFVHVQTMNDTGKAYYDDGWYSGQINGIVIAWCEIPQFKE